MNKFLKTVFEYLIIRPITRSKGIYFVTVVEYDAIMTAPFCYSYYSCDLCLPYHYRFNRYVDALDFYNKTIDNHIVPTDDIKLSYVHKSQGVKKLSQLKW